MTNIKAIVSKIVQPVVQNALNFTRIFSEDLFPANPVWTLGAHWTVVADTDGRKVQRNTSGFHWLALNDVFTGEGAGVTYRIKIRVTGSNNGGTCQGFLSNGSATNRVPIFTYTGDGYYEGEAVSLSDTVDLTISSDGNLHVLEIISIEKVIE